MNINELKFDDKNFNKHTERGLRLIEKSLRENGAGRSILLDKDNNIIAGNGVIEIAGQIGLEKIKVVETTGDEIVAVKRTDISLNSHQGREMALADNATSAADLDSKPLALCQRAIKTSSREGETVLDLFGGSGSTLIACEQTGRKCYMMELDSKYCDVIRKRYWKFKTGSEEGWQDGTRAI